MRRVLLLMLLAACSNNEPPRPGRTPTPEELAAEAKANFIAQQDAKDAKHEAEITALRAQYEGATSDAEKNRIRAQMAALASGRQGQATTNSAPLPDPWKVDFGVRAEELLRVYKGNELAGDLRFKGKRIRVNGFVREVASVMGKPMISVGGTFDRVRCYFDKSSLRMEQVQEMATIKKGVLINVDGVVRGAGPMGGVVLDVCLWPTNVRVQRETPELLQRR